MDSDREGSAGRPADGLGSDLSASEGRRSVTGTVTDTLPHAMYRVRLEQGRVVLAHIADRMDRNFVRILVGDKVRLELSPVDVGRGRIVERL